MTAEEAMQYFLEHPKEFERCILCNAPSVYIGMFIPDDSIKFGGIPGKQRIYGYGICEECKGESSAQDCVERVILAKYKQIRGITGNA